MDNRGKKLPESTRLRIRALLLEGRSVREVADITKVSTPTVQAERNRLFQGKIAGLD